MASHLLLAREYYEGEDGYFVKSRSNYPSTMERMICCQPREYFQIKEIWPFPPYFTV